MDDTTNRNERVVPTVGLRTAAILVASVVLVTGCRQRKDPREDCTPTWANFNYSSSLPKGSISALNAEAWSASAGVLSSRGAGMISQGPTKGDFDVEITVSALEGEGAAFGLRAGNKEKSGFGNFASADVFLGGGRTMLDVNTDRGNADGSLPATLRLERRGRRVTATASGGGVKVTETREIEEESVYVVVDSLIAAPGAARVGPFLATAAADLCTDRFRGPIVIRGEVTMGAGGELLDASHN